MKLCLAKLGNVIRSELTRREYTVIEEYANGARLLRPLGHKTSAFDVWGYASLPCEVVGHNEEIANLNNQDWILTDVK